MSDSADPVPPARRFGWHLTPPDPLPIRTGSAAGSCGVSHPPEPPIDGTTSFKSII
ncbi:MAG: hypothetical protein AVDCRST_MAG53-691 [uncultured Solirubrobacteraceae bacterium]|uniref:Uncharacterized protein n=1 Tax=uncultured Solirubrobacteraceae bacterium TaxID=1162706 RepID=A0A6J4RT29_9ACTN|nr:MAG: hypothetical protein AVDCRST_MAG53-691 [uncultured Solirubrobacteraceae bacterium]